MLHAVNSDGRPSSVEKLAFKYMELCKLESSTDSESDISLRSSDTSTMALVSTSRPDRRPLQKSMLSLSHKGGGRLPCYCRFLDPYDGSSEDSDESSSAPAGVLGRRPRQQHGGACSHLLCRGRRFVTLLQPPASVPAEVTKREPRAPTAPTSTPGPLLLQHPADVQMDSDGSSSEPWVRGPDAPRSSVADQNPAPGETSPASGDGPGGGEEEEEEEDRFEDSGLHSATGSPPPPPPPSAGSASHAAETSPDPGGHSGCLYKRKTMETAESGQRKKQCVVSMKEEYPRQGGCTAEMQITGELKCSKALYSVQRTATPRS
ncbi:hypothetical protein N1851_023334 [Merluccius polli]|uniref:Uncharacterized protein n=1 Tax=Merluccius polli TaxID=89951 RepID=A0AA47NV52_MERPO|nr:hypothetical protein N1851_023334 [Merluccius polli]